MSVLAAVHPSRIQTEKNYKIKPKVVPSLKVSESLYWEKYYEHPTKNYEWNNGYLEEKPVSDYATFLIYNWLMKLFGFYFETYHNGALVNLEMGFRLDLPEKVTIRKPDLGVITNLNPVQFSLRDRTYQGIFDLCIEALSDSSKKEIFRDTVIKKQEYAQAGVKEYFIVYDKEGDINTEMEFYHLGDDGVYQPIERREGDLIQSQLFPGFQFRISDLHKRPEQKAMCEDPVYRNFVFPAYQQQKQRADLEEQRANSEEKRADLEEQRANSEKQRADLEKQRANSEEQRANNAEQEIFKLKKKLSQM
jgi:Uma2 family endonuclease